MRFRAYGRTVDSDRGFPELEPVAGAGTADFRVTWEAHVRAPAGVRWSTLWRFSNGEPWVTTARADGSRYLRFARFADCRLSSARIEVAPRGHVTDATLRHLVLDQALPLALAASGALVVHASAVAREGRAILLTGKAGAGKSTLAALLATRGFRVLADDGVVLEAGAAGPIAVPSYPGLRLYRDSIAAAALALEGSTDVAEYTSKLRVVPPAAEAAAGGPPLPLAAIYSLAEGEDGIRVDPLSRRDATIEVLSHAYRVDLENARALEAQLDAVARLAPAVFRVAFPRRLGAAPELARAVAAHAGSLR